MFNRGNTLALRYAIYRTHLLEKHVNALYSILRERLPDEADTLEALIQDWQNEIGNMHQAFLNGDKAYFDAYERRFP